MGSVTGLVGLRDIVFAVMPPLRTPQGGQTMYGWRGILGSIGPSSGDVFTYEFYRMAPRGVLLTSTPGSIRQLDPQSIERQLERLEEAAIDLDDAGVDLIM